MMKKMMKRKRIASMCALAIVPVVMFAIGCASEDRSGSMDMESDEAAVSGQVQAPRFEVDPFWPKPLPNNLVMGWVIGVAADANDNIWILQRPDQVDRSVTPARTAPPGNDPNLQANRAELADKWVQSATTPDGRCCSPFPSYVLQFDQEGHLLKHWGGPTEGYGLDWPFFPHGLSIDYKGNVWIASNTLPDSRVSKYTQDGQYLMSIGTRGIRGDSNDPKNMGAPGGVTVDPETNEAYVSDGSTNRRIVVFDADTGEYKRHWGAYGNRPDDTVSGPFDPSGPPPQQFNGPHCSMIANNGLVYVCDWRNNRIQVFQKDGTFVNEAFVERETPRFGSLIGIAFSADPEQRYLYVGDGANQKVHILRRDTLEVLTSFGSAGRQPGQFWVIHNIATDSMGNIYVTDTFSGARVQKFLYKGVGPVSVRDQGPPWPESAR